MAEYHELPMVLAALRKSLESERWNESRIPSRFLLNKGHVTFFYNKRQFIKSRYKRLIHELRKRDYQIDPDARNVDFAVYKGVRNITWTPDEDEILISLQRIVERHKFRPKGFYTYYGEPISVAKYTVLALSHVNKG